MRGGSNTERKKQKSFENLNKMEARKIRPRNPHFFKPILPNSFEELSIPIAFLRYLVGEECEDGEAVLRSHRRGKSWRVKFNGLRFQEGWKDFARDHALRVGDLVVFRHEGGLLFDVTVFGATTCEKEYPPPFEEKAQRRGKEVVVKDTNKKSIPKARRVMTSSEGQKAAKAEGATSFKSKHPYFVVSVHPYSLNIKSRMHIPTYFARSYGLEGKCCEMVLKDQKGRSWTVNLRYGECSRKTYIGAGWRQFSVANGLKKGDVCVFELTCAGKIPVMEVHLL